MDLRGTTTPEPPANLGIALELSNSSDAGESSSGGSSGEDDLFQSQRQPSSSAADGIEPHELPFSPRDKLSPYRLEPHEVCVSPRDQPSPDGLESHELSVSPRDKLSRANEESPAKLSERELAERDSYTTTDDFKDANLPAGLQEIRIGLVVRSLDEIISPRREDQKDVPPVRPLCAAEGVIIVSDVDAPLRGLSPIDCDVSPTWDLKENRPEPCPLRRETLAPEPLNEPKSESPIAPEPLNELCDPVNVHSVEQPVTSPRTLMRNRLNLHGNDVQRADTVARPMPIGRLSPLPCDKPPRVCPSNYPTPPTKTETDSQLISKPVMHERQLRVNTVPPFGRSVSLPPAGSPLYPALQSSEICIARLVKNV